jgi:hypothetical protein
MVILTWLDENSYKEVRDIDDGVLFSFLDYFRLEA